MSKNFKLFLTIFLAILFTSFNFITTSAQSTLFEDNFNDSIISPSFWNIDNYALEHTGSNDSNPQLYLSTVNSEIKIFGEGTLGAILIDNQYVGWLGKSLILNNFYQSTNNYTVQTSTRFEYISSQAQAHLTFEFNNNNNRIILNLGKAAFGDSVVGQTQLQFDENNDSRCVGLTLENENVSDCDISLPFNLEIGTIYNLKISFNPFTRIVSGYIDGNLIHQGHFRGTISDFQVGVAATVREIGDTIDVRFDNFKVTIEDNIPTATPTPTLTPTPTPSETPTSNYLNVPDVKQLTNPWGSLEYDSAQNWSPTNPTISRWGCAMTSSTMLLNYYGYPINPQDLNAWLKQNNGYNRNGGILWPAVTRYTKLSTDGIKPVLEFSYHNPDVNYLSSEITAGRPSILKMVKPNGNTHFIVAKGENNNDFNVNDPASNTYSVNLLSQARTKWGTNSKIGTFIPSHTDLSYIILYVDKNFDLKVSSSSGELTEGYIEEGPIVAADDENVNSGESLKAFYLPKPPVGKYDLVVNGIGKFQLDAYLYDLDGNVHEESIEETAQQGVPSHFTINFEDNLKYIFPEEPDKGFDYLIKSLQKAQIEKLINDYDLFDSLTNLITNSKKQFSKDKIFTAKILLNVALFKIKYYTPYLIESEYSAVIQEQINLLLNSL